MKKLCFAGTFAGTLLIALTSCLSLSSFKVIDNYPKLFPNKKFSCSSEDPYFRWFERSRLIARDLDRWSKFVRMNSAYQNERMVQRWHGTDARHLRFPLQKIRGSTLIARQLSWSSSFSVPMSVEHSLVRKPWFCDFDRSLLDRRLRHNRLILCIAKMNRTIIKRAESLHASLSVIRYARVHLRNNDGNGGPSPDLCDLIN